MSLTFVEGRLYNAQGTAYTILNSFQGLAFDDKYNDFGAISFDYPLKDAEALGLTDNSLVGIVCSNGVSTKEVQRYVVQTTNDEKVVDKIRMKTFGGKSSLMISGDAIVYPSNWEKPLGITTRSLAGGVATLGFATDPILLVGDKVYVIGLESQFEGLQTVTASTSTTISFQTTGSDVANGAAPAGSQILKPTTPSGHSFAESNPGTIWRTLFLRAKNRGCFPQLDETSFSGTGDSNGVPWADLLTVNYGTGDAYDAILLDQMQRGVVDAWLEGWTLKMVNGGTRGQHIPISTLELRPALNITEATKSTDSTDSATNVLIEGDSGVVLERTSGIASALIGRRKERGVNQSGISDIGTLTILADSELDSVGRIPTEETVGVTSNLTPFFDFNVADWLQTRYETDQAPTERRVWQVAVQVDAAGQTQVGMTLNSILFEEDVKLRRKIDAYAGSGGSYGTIGSGVDTSIPNAPTVGSRLSSVYLGPEGSYSAVVVIPWTGPTTNVDGSQFLDFDHYEYSWRYNAESGWIDFNTDASPGRISPVIPGETILTRVRVVDKSGNRSAWVEQAPYQVTKDTTPPPIPSTPVATQVPGAVRVTWDGLTSTGAVQPNDFDFVEVWYSTVANFTPGDPGSTRASSLLGAGYLDILGNPPPATTYVRLVAVDKANNAQTTPSGVTSAVRGAVVAPPVQPSVSPAVTVTPFAIGQLRASWTPLGDADPSMRYEVYASYVSPVSTSSELVGIVSGNSIQFSNLGGSQIPMEPATTVYVRVRAVNASGPGPLGAEGSAAPRAADQQYISALYAYLGSIEAGQIDSGTLSASISISTDGVIFVGDNIAISTPKADGTGGIEIWAAPIGNAPPRQGPPIVRLHPNGSVFEGSVTADEITVVESLKLLNSLYFSSASSSVLQNGIADPIGKPTLTATTPSTSFPSVGSPYREVGTQWDAATNTWFQYFALGNTLYYRRVNPAGAVTTGNVPFKDYNTSNGFYLPNVAGVAYVSPGYFIVAFAGANANTTRLEVFDSNASIVGTYVSGEGFVTDEYTISAPAGYVAASAGLGSNLGISDGGYYCESNTSGTTRIIRISASNGHVSTVGSWSYLSTGQAESVPRNKNIIRDTFDFGDGITRFCIPTQVAVRFYPQPTWSGETSSADASLGFTPEGDINIGGFSFKTSGVSSGDTLVRGFYSHSSSGRHYFYPNIYPTAGLNAYAVYRDMIGSSGTGISPESDAFAVPRRRYMSVSLPVAPPGITSSDVYVGYGMASTGMAKFKRPKVGSTTEAFSGRLVTLYDGVINASTGGYTDLRTIGQLTVTNRVRTASGVVTLTTSSAHGLSVGQKVNVLGVQAAFDGIYTVLVVNDAFNFSYQTSTLVAAATASSGGTVLRNSLGGSPAELRSEAGGFVAKGDGTGAWPYIMPPGTVLQGLYATVPAGFIAADGATYPRSGIYKDLADSMGIAANASTFAVPDATGRVLVSRDSGTFSVIGSIGGSYTYSVGEHQHVNTFGSDINTMYAWQNGSGYGVYGTGVVTAVRRNSFAAATAANNAAARYDLTGPGGSFAVSTIQPWVAVRAIIKL
jgi:microcystin-dependent protein